MNMGNSIPLDQCREAVIKMMDEVIEIMLKNYTENFEQYALHDPWEIEHCGWVGCMESFEKKDFPVVQAKEVNGKLFSALHEYGLVDPTYIALFFALDYNRSLNLIIRKPQLGSIIEYLKQKGRVEYRPILKFDDHNILSCFKHKDGPPNDEVVFDVTAVSPRSMDIAQSLHRFQIWLLNEKKAIKLMIEELELLYLG
jgi:hypothetical protein